VIRRLFQPWAGLIGGVAGWYLSQQAGSNLVFARCTAGYRWSVLLLDLCGLILAGAGALLSWRVWQEEEDSGSARRFIGLLALLLAVTLAFPVLMQVVAGLLVPGCAS
jgi:hypothetical protein